MQQGSLIQQGPTPSSCPTIPPASHAARASEFQGTSQKLCTPRTPSPYLLVVSAGRSLQPLSLSLSALLASKSLEILSSAYKLCMAMLERAPREAGLVLEGLGKGACLACPSTRHLGWLAAKVRGTRPWLRETNLLSFRYSPRCPRHPCSRWKELHSHAYTTICLPNEDATQRSQRRCLPCPLVDEQDAIPSSYGAWSLGCRPLRL